MIYSGHNHITRKSLVAFMSFFEGIKVEKYNFDEKNDALIHGRFIDVPVQFASVDKFISFLTNPTTLPRPPEYEVDASHSYAVQWLLPRISVNLNNFAYDSSRHLNKTNYATPDTTSYIKEMRAQNKTSALMKRAPVPYNITMQLSIVGKTYDDVLQVTEQIIPYFTPSYSMDIKYFHDLPAESVPIILTGVSQDFPDELTESNTKIYIMTLDFLMKINYYHVRKEPEFKGFAIQNEANIKIGDYSFSTDELLLMYLFNRNDIDLSNVDLTTGDVFNKLKILGVTPNMDELKSMDFSKMDFNKIKPILDKITTQYSHYLQVIKLNGWVDTIDVDSNKAFERYIYMAENPSGN